MIPGRYALSVGRPDRPAPTGWTWTLLTDVARLETGHTPSRKHPEYWDGDVPWIGIKDAVENHGYTIYDTYQHTNELGLANSSARLLPADTVCLSRTASLGYVVVMGVPMATSQDFVNWVCSDAIDHRFLKYVLVAEHDTYPMFASGATHQTVYLPEVKAFHAMLPPPRTQQRIADVLSAFDDLIANNNRRIEILEEMARVIYRHWFVDFKYPGHEDVPLVDSELGPIPDGWAVKPFSEAAEFINGYAFGPDHWSDEGLPIIKIKELKNGVTEDTPRYHGKDLKNKYFIENGDILFSWSGDLDAYLWNGGSGLLNQHLFHVVPKGQERFYVFHALKRAMDHFRARSGGTTMKHIKRSALKEVSLAVPPKAIQESFLEVVGPMHQLVLNLSSTNGGLKQVRDLLLPKLVSGEIDVSHLDVGDAA